MCLTPSLDSELRRNVILCIFETLAPGMCLSSKFAHFDRFLQKTYILQQVLSPQIANSLLYGTETTYDTQRTNEQWFRKHDIKLTWEMRLNFCPLREQVQPSHPFMCDRNKLSQPEH